MNRTGRCKCIVLASLFAGLMLWPAVYVAQTPKAKVSILDALAEQIRDTNNRVRGWRVVVKYDTALLPTDSATYLNPENYHVINVIKGSRLFVTEVREYRPVAAGVLVGVELRLPGEDTFNGSDLFHVYATGVLFDGKSTVDPLQLPIDVRIVKAEEASDPSSTINQSASDLPKPAWALASSDDRDSSDLYLSYQVTSVRHKATTGSGDVKVRVPFRADFWKRAHTFSPFFDLKASSDSEADPDSLKFGIEWNMPLLVGNNPDAKWPYTQLNLVTSGYIEAPKDFDNVNGITEARFIAPGANLFGGSSKAKFFIDPFVSLQVGKNLKSPVASIEGHSLARLLYGANASLEVPAPLKPVLSSIEFESSFSRLNPFSKEFTFKNKDDGTKVITAYGTGPKTYSNSKLIFKTNDFFGPYIGYEWGQLPPNYNLVDHKWTFGLLFKSKIRVR